MKNGWVVSEGVFGNDITHPVGVFFTKNKAKKFCRKQGFKFSSVEQIFYRDETRLYREVRGPFKIDEETP